MSSDPLPLRVPDHGPYVENSGGGKATPGTGFTSREAYSIGPFSEAVLPQAGEAFTTVPAVLTAVHRANRYQVEWEVHGRLGPTFSANGTLTYQLQYSKDAGATWTTFYSVAADYTAAGAGSPIDSSLCTSPILGSSFPGGGVIEGEAARVRGRIALNSEGGGADGEVTFNWTEASYTLRFREML